MNRRAWCALGLAAMLAACGQPAPPPGVTGDPVRGRLALAQHA